MIRIYGTTLGSTSSDKADSGRSIFESCVQSSSNRLFSRNSTLYKRTHYFAYVSQMLQFPVLNSGYFFHFLSNLRVADFLHPRLRTMFSDKNESRTLLIFFYARTETVTFHVLISTFCGLASIFVADPSLV